jgi:glycosyltransferase involved in cell wall biosynthesis
LFAADEDFGLVSVEAQAFGRPVVAFGRGGSLETVRGLWTREIGAGGAVDHSKYTGVFFPEQSVSSLMGAILDFERVEDVFEPGTIRNHARRFDVEVFVVEVRRYVEAQMETRSTSRCRAYAAST